jgi:hypothetical protein
LLVVLLRERDTGADGHLRTDNTVTAKEGRGEDVHRTALAVRHAVDAT